MPCRDVQEEEETTPWAEQQTWEAEQIKKASMRVGSKDKRKEKEYDLVFEDQIDFISDHLENGDLEVCILSFGLLYPDKPGCKVGTASYLVICNSL